MMELKIVGSSSSGNSMLLYNGWGEYILLDCGMEVRKCVRMADSNWRAIQFGLLSHVHLDHSMYVQYWLDKGLRIYMPGKFTNEEGKEVGCKDPFFKKWTNAIEVPPMKKFSVPKFQKNDQTKLVKHSIADIIPFVVPHDGVHCYSYIINFDGHRIAWLTDLEYCPYDLRRFQLTDIIVECNYIDSQIGDDEISQKHFRHKLKGHMGLNACKKFVEHNAKDNHYLNNVVLIHTSETIDRDYIKREIQSVVPCAVYVAEPGMVVNLSLDGLEI